MTDSTTGMPAGYPRGRSMVGGGNPRNTWRTDLKGHNIHNGHIYTRPRKHGWKWEMWALERPSTLHT